MKTPIHPYLKQCTAIFSAQIHVSGNTSLQGNSGDSVKISSSLVHSDEEMLVPCQVISNIVYTCNMHACQHFLFRNLNVAVITDLFITVIKVKSYLYSHLELIDT